MRIRLVAGLLLASVVTASADTDSTIPPSAGAASPAGRWPVPAPGGVPEAWSRQGWEISGRARRGYSVEEDPSVTRLGHATLRLAPKVEPGGYATFMRLV